MTEQKAVQPSQWRVIFPLILVLSGVPIGMLEGYYGSFSLLGILSLPALALAFMCYLLKYRFWEIGTIGFAISIVQGVAMLYMESLL